MDRNSIEWLENFRAYIYQNHRNVALEAENHLLAQIGVKDMPVSFGAVKPEHDPGDE